MQIEATAKRVGKSQLFMIYCVSFYFRQLLYSETLLLVMKNNESLKPQIHKQSWRTGDCLLLMKGTKEWNYYLKIEKKEIPACIFRPIVQILSY